MSITPIHLHIGLKEKYVFTYEVSVTVCFTLTTGSIYRRKTLKFFRIVIIHKIIKQACIDIHVVGVFAESNKKHI